MKEIVFDNGTIATPTNLQDCYIIKPRVFGDERGYFNPYYIKEYIEKFGFQGIVQTNRSLSSRGVLRGLHFQENPYSQAKLVEVISGSAIDVVVDMRVGSPTYGKSTYLYLSPYNSKFEESGRQLYVPRGFAHGFVALEDNTIFQYLIDNKYEPKSENGILWNDPDLDIDWNELFDKYNLSEDDIKLSEKDTKRLSLSKSPDHFVFSKKNITHIK